MAKAAERLVWAVEMLAVEPDDHILEIGRGHGVAVSLVCEQLDSSAITAIDCSAKMIAMATHRNREHVASGNATFQEAALDAADFGNERFDKIFAVHVRSTWTRPAIELPIIKRLLKPNGSLFLFNQAPGWTSPGDSRAFTDQVTATLQDHGFSVTAVSHKDIHPWPAVCIRAEAVWSKSSRTRGIGGMSLTACPCRGGPSCPPWFDCKTVGIRTWAGTATCPYVDRLTSPNGG